MLADSLAPISMCAYKNVQQQNKEEAFQDGDSTGKTRHCLSCETAGELALFVNFFCYSAHKPRFHVSLLAQSA